MHSSIVVYALSVLRVRAVGHVGLLLGVCARYTGLATQGFCVWVSVMLHLTPLFLGMMHLYVHILWR